MIPLDTYVHPLGKIAAVGLVSGERYYWTVGHDGAVGMLPASVVEPMAEQQNNLRKERHD